MAGKKGKPHRRERIKVYYRDRHELNALRKKEKHEERIQYFKERNEKFAELIPNSVKDFLTHARMNYYISKLEKKTYTNLIHELASTLAVDKNLPRGRIKQELRLRLPKP